MSTWVVVCHVSRVDPDIRLSMIKTKKNRCWFQIFGSESCFECATRACFCAENNVRISYEAAGFKSNVSAYLRPCMILVLPARDVTERRPLAGLAHLFTLATKPNLCFERCCPVLCCCCSALLCCCVAAVHDARAQRLRGGTTGAG